MKRVPWLGVAIVLALSSACGRIATAPRCDHYAIRPETVWTVEAPRRLLAVSSRVVCTEY